MFVETRNGHGRRFVARAVSGDMHRAVAKDASGATRRYAFEGTGELSPVAAKGTSGQGAPDLPRSTPGSPFIPSCVKKEKKGRLLAVNEEKSHAAYGPRPENDSRRITEEEVSHAPEHWNQSFFRRTDLLPLSKERKNT